MTLSQLALKHDTDKGPQHHNYTAIYERYLDPLRHTKQTLLELGVGGYEFPDRGGQSLRMWVEYAGKDWFISAIDVHKKEFEVAGAFIIPCSQDDDLALQLICRTAQPTIIIDDASHINPLTIRSFEILFPLLAPGGLYIVEDTETSYWGIIHDGTDYGGGVETGIVAHLKYYIDVPEVEYIHFYKGVIIIKKK